MKNIFDFKRFGKYFLYDLNNARNTFGISGLCLALSPVLAFVAFSAIQLIMRGRITDYPDTLQVITLLILTVSLMISFTTKAYGNLTEKRLGSDWLMIPASGFEKTLSMILISCFVIPAILFAIFFASDWLLSVIFDQYPSSLIGSFSFKQEISQDITLGSSGFALATWCETVMAFLLGSIFFKRAKAGKTILTIFGVSMIISTLAILILNGSIGIDSANIEAFIVRLEENFDAQKAANIFNIVLNGINFLIIGVLSVLTYLRVKTMKH